MPELVAVRLPDARAAAATVEDVWAAGDAVVVLDPLAPDAAVAELLARVRPGALVHTRPDGTGPKITRLDGVPVGDGTAAVVLTSGSTGTPRAVVLSAAAMDASADATIARLGCAPGDVWLGCLPLHHVAGLAVLRRAARLGAPADVQDGFDVASVAASPARWWPLVPTMLARLVRAGTDLAGRGILLGGAPPDPGVVAAATSAGATVTVSYGMTETCGGCVYDGVPLDGVEVDVGGAQGRIRLRGPVLADGERGTDGSVVPVVDPDGWLPSGDVGALVDGRLVVHGRADHVILTGGENVAPEAVERVLTEHAEVLDAGVLGREDPEWGQRVVALVVARNPVAPPSLEELRDHVGAQLGRHAGPRELHLVDAVPHTSLGKVARAALRDLLPPER